MKELIKYLKNYKKECILAPLFKLLEALFELIVPLAVAALIDRGIGRNDTAFVLKMGGIMVLLGAAGLIFAITAQYYAAAAATGFSSKVRRALFSAIQTFDFETLDKTGTGTLITRMTSDVAQVQNGLNMFLRLFLRSPFIVFGAMIMAFTVDLQGALVFVVLIPVLFIIVAGIMRITRPAYRMVQSKLDGIAGRTRENLTGVRVIRAFHGEKREEEDFVRENDELVKMQERTGGISALMNPLTLVTVNLFTAGLIYVGAVRVDNGYITRGSVVALVNYMSQILIELVKLANLVVLLTKAMASADRVGEILNKERKGSGEKQGFPAENGRDPYISFDNVSLRYEEGSDLALENITFAVNKGDTVGVIGGTGSGKSSLVSLIPGYYTATEGSVRINGADIRDIDEKELRKRTGMVFQKTDLFSGSIRDNLLWGDPDASDRDLEEAVTAAQAAEFVNEKPGGLDYFIEQGGKNLSGGQKQRLTIARALVRHPEILIMDDSASALDFATDAHLRSGIREMAGSMTIFIVSQRAASVMHSDLIIVLDDGRIAGMGKHEDLLRDNEVYREIYYSQFPEEE